MYKEVENKEDYCSVCPYGASCKNRYNSDVHIKVRVDHPNPKDKCFWCTSLK